MSSGGAEGCCALSDEVAGSAFWTFAPSGDVATPGSGEGGGVCTFFPYTHVRPSMRLDATSGRSDPRIRLSDFRDVIHDSCLNGWTMSNSDHTGMVLLPCLFVQCLSTPGKTDDTMAKANDWVARVVLCGLFAGELVLPLKGVYRCNGLPACQCALFRGCTARTRLAILGSTTAQAAPLAFVTELNISYAVAVNASSRKWA